MSTKQTILYADQYHLFRDAFDDDHVYLTLNDVNFDVSSFNYSSQVTVILPNNVAKELGLIK